MPGSVPKKRHFVNAGTPPRLKVVEVAQTMLAQDFAAVAAYLPLAP